MILLHRTTTRDHSCDSTLVLVKRYHKEHNLVKPVKNLSILRMRKRLPKRKRLKKLGTMLVKILQLNPARTMVISKRIRPLRKKMKQLLLQLNRKDKGKSRKKKSYKKRKLKKEKDRSKKKKPHARNNYKNNKKKQTGSKRKRKLKKRQLLMLKRQKTLRRIWKNKKMKRELIKKNTGLMKY